MTSNKPYYSKKIPAFTIPELVVSMLLMSILFGIIATVYMIITKQSQRNYAITQIFTEYISTKKVMQNDFDQATTATLGQLNKISLRIFAQNQPITITYEIDSLYILRRIDEKTDTLLPGAVITQTTIVADTIPLLTTLKLSHLYKGLHFSSILEKKYAVSDLLTDSITSLTTDNESTNRY